MCERMKAASILGSKMILYGDVISPPVRFVLMTLDALKIKENVIFRHIDLMKSKQKSEDFLKINPCGQVPVLQHDSLLLRDSHTICPYLVDLLAPNSTLYPADISKRAKINEMLCFNMTFFFPADSSAMGGFFSNNPENCKDHFDEILKSYRLLNMFCKNTKWIAGEEVTLADFCLLPTLSTTELLLPLDKEVYGHAYEWSERMNQLPESRINRQGVEELKNVIEKWAAPKQ